MGSTAILMITLPIFMPVIRSLHLDPIWFCTAILVNIEMGLITPPFGMILFVMKAVAPPHITMDKIYRAAYPFLGLDLIAMAIMIAYPQVVLWLPSFMQ